MSKKLISGFIVLLVVIMTFSPARSYRLGQVPYSSKWSCNTCHLDGGGTPRNPFGAAVEAMTGPANVSFWGPSLAAADSDQDGFANGIELQDSAGVWADGTANPGTASLVTHPGDASDFPSTVRVSNPYPSDYLLENNYPNPFNPSTIINYYLPLASHVKIDIFNVIGEKVATLVDENATQGSYYTIWNGLNDQGNIVNSGLYFYRMQANNFSDVKRMVYVK